MKKIVLIPFSNKVFEQTTLCCEIIGQFVMSFSPPTLTRDEDFLHESKKPTFFEMTSNNE